MVVCGVVLVVVCLFVWPVCFPRVIEERVRARALSVAKPSLHANRSLFPALCACR